MALSHTSTISRPDPGILAQRRLAALRWALGHVEAGAGRSVHIGQDDATKEWGLRVGEMRDGETYSAGSFESLLDSLALAMDADPERH